MLVIYKQEASKMKEFSDGSTEEISGASTRINNCLFKRISSAKHVPVEERSSDNPDYKGIDPLHATIIRITDGFCFDLRQLAIEGDETHLRKALRSFIDVLDELYDQM